MNEQNNKNTIEKFVDDEEKTKIIDELIEQKIRKKGSGRKKGAKGRKDKYILDYQNKRYLCKSMIEIAELTGRSRMCINRLINGSTTFRCKERTKELRQIKIEKII